MQNEQFYGIALSLLKGVGNATAKTMISYAGSAEALFKLSMPKLQKIQGVGPKLAQAFKDSKLALARAEKELKFMDKNKIDILFYYDAKYPKRLLNCADAPLYLFSKGKIDFNKQKFVNIVGTRKATQYGKEITAQLIEQFSRYNISIVSGLAYGIDIFAHKMALNYPIQNIAVLAHGLDRIYPSAHTTIAEKLQNNGAIVSDFLSETIPDKQNFPSRNRIVAGMTDATIVIESAIAGGALITAEIANNYNRDVFAFPGRTTDMYSAGCLNLIKKNKAHLVTDAADIIALMNWDIEQKSTLQRDIQAQLFIELNEEERQIIKLLSAKEKQAIDELIFHLALPPTQLSSILLQLEMKGAVMALPGKMYKTLI